MPFQDTSDVLLDPDFATIFDVYRSTQAVSTGGIATDTPEPIATGISGVVQPASGLSMQRLAEGERQTGAIHVWTRYRLSSGLGNEEAHVVSWNGAAWVVVNVDDWSQFGAGFIRATCDLTNLNV